MQIADVAALPLCALVLQTLDELILGLPLTPAMARDEAVGQMLLRPRDIIIHLGLCRLFLKLLDLLLDVARLSVKVDRHKKTAEKGECRDNRSCCPCVMSSEQWGDCTPGNVASNPYPADDEHGPACLDRSLVFGTALARMVSVGVRPRNQGRALPCDARAVINGIPGLARAGGALIVSSWRAMDTVKRDFMYSQRVRLIGWAPSGPSSLLF